jgi:hypothetical protein
VAKGTQHAPIATPRAYSARTAPQLRRCPARTSTYGVGRLSASKPALQFGSIDDAEHQQHVVVVNDVVHHAVVADPQAMEGVVGATDGLDRLPRDATWAGHVMRESLECSADPIAVGVSELLELPGRRT